MAHRWSYEFFIGVIANGLTIDHLCRNTLCVNPTHLEPVAQSVNLDRAPTALATINKLKMACPRGHSYDYANLGRRYCKICKLDWQRRKRAEAA